MWKIGTAKIWSLGTFTRTPEYRIIWEARFEHWIAQRLQHYRAFTVRSPKHEHSLWSIYEFGPDHEEDVGWHQDGTDGRPSYLGCWSNTFGTEIRVKDSEQVYHGLPGEFLVFDNSFFEHKIPDIGQTAAAERWFVRLHTNGAVLEHPDVCTCEL